MDPELTSLVIVHAYNEERIISKVIKDIKNNFEIADIVVVNDGSTDKTADNAREKIIQKFSVDNMVEETVRIFESAITRKKE